MRQSGRLLLCVSMFCTLALLPAIASAQATKKATRTKTPKTESKAPSIESETKLPDMVRKTLDAKFPNAKIEKVSPEKEGGVMVYDIEFREGRNHKETDITEDGTMIESTVLVTRKEVPKEVMKPMRAAAEGGKMARVEKIEITHETKDGKVVKLDKPKTHYAVEITKDGKTAEIVVDAQGKAVEEPKWAAPKPKEETKKPA